MSQDTHFSSEFEAAVMHRRSHNNLWKERLGALIAAFVIAGGLVAYYNARRVVPDQIALGAAVQTKPGFWNGMAVEGHRVQDYPGMFPPKMPPGDNRLWVWTGNSQMHAINQIKENDEVASVHATRLMGFPVFGLSIPNSSLRENYATVAWALSRSKPQWVIVPVVYYMFRMYDLRAGFADIYDEQAKKTLASTPSGVELLKEIEKLGVEENKDAQGTSRLGFSLQDYTERHLNDALSRFSQVWRDRDQSYAAVVADWYTWRQWAMRIKTDTKRPMIPARLAANMQALESLIELAKLNGAKVLVYVAPIRWDVEPPYELPHYQSWKLELQKLCEKDGATYLDLDRLIPDTLWGTVSDQVDFMHFQGQGHEILGKKIVEEIKKAEATADAAGNKGK